VILSFLGTPRFIWDARGARLSRAVDHFSLVAPGRDFISQHLFSPFLVSPLVWTSVE